MSAALELIRLVESAGGRFMVDGDRLGIVPGEAAAPVIEQLRQHKAEIISLLDSASIPPRNPAEWRETFARWLDSACVRHPRCFGGVACLHIAFCEWESGRGGVPCNRGSFERLLTERGFLLGEVAGVVLVSGLILKDDWLAHERFQNPELAKNGSSRTAYPWEAAKTSERSP